jgi:C4-dicarboxylate-specific signal transduction histidine kinase
MDRRIFLLAGAVAPFASAARAAPDEAAFTIDASILVRSFQAVIEYQIADIMRSLHQMAAAGDADTGDWKSIAPTLETFCQQTMTRPTGWLSDTQGRYVTTFDDKAAPDSLRERPYFTDLLQGRDVVGEALVSTVSGLRCVLFATPIVRSGRVVGAIGLEIPARAVMDVIDAYYKLPDGLVLMILNDSGLIIVHSERSRIFRTPDVAEPSMRATMKRILTEASGAVSYRARGTGRLAVFSKSDHLGWHFVLAKTTK